MKSTLTSILALVAAVAAAPDPTITPRAELAPRQSGPLDPALLGWASGEKGECKLYTHQDACQFLALLQTEGVNHI